MAVSATSVEDEIQKRNTDCVYFLASPLTCKKGSECEYRHSELARLNPRDCWYWLAGSCINPACSFRHPPLEGLSESSHPVQPTVTEKMNVPCYFFFNAYCNKGDLCQFLHGPPTFTAPPQKPLHSASGLQADHPPDNKASAGSDTGSASVEVPTNFFEGTSKASAAPTNDIVVSERSPSLQPSIPECDEASMGKLLENPPVYTDGGESPEQASDPGEREERWESSPGFDVLVDDGSDQLPYDEEHDYPLDGKHHLFPYEYKEMVGYEDQMDTMLYDHAMYGSYDHVDDAYIPDHVHGERMLSAEPRERRRFPPRREIVINDHDDGLDLRDQLRKRRRNGQGPPWRRRDGERSVRHGREIQRRLVSEVGMNMISSLHSESDHSGFNGGVGRRRWSGRLQRSRSRSRQRQRERERERRRQMRRPPRFTSEIVKERRSIRADAGFSGPKTLAQIKEEKRAAEAARDGGPNSASNDNGESAVKPLMEDFDGDFDYDDDDLFDEEEDGGLGKRILKKMCQVDHNEDNDTDEDALEALFSQLEEDLKNGNLSDDDGDDEITDEDLARLEQELAGALGDEDDDDEFIEMSNSNEDHMESNDEDDEEVRTRKLKNWQLRRLASALKIGRRKTSIKSLAAELGLDRALVLELLRDPPPNLLLMSASLPDKVVPTPLEPEKSTVSFPPTTLSEEPEISTIESKVIKAPVHVMRGKWAMQKRLKKVQVEILEKVYARTKRPTRTMISSIVHVTNLPWKKVVKWFEDKRIEDGVPDKRFPYQRSVPETISTN